MSAVTGSPVVSHMTRKSEPDTSRPHSPPEQRRATVAGTQLFRQRFETTFASDFFRLTTFGAVASSIGIGTYLGEPDDGDDAAYESAIALAVRSGINVIDTAINYRAQRSERAVGSAIQHALDDGTVARDALIVCTKGGYIPLEGAVPSNRDAYREYVRREFVEPRILHPDDIVAGGHSLAPRFLKYCIAKSRQNLGLRTIDVYYLHNPAQQLVAVSRQDLYKRLRAAMEAMEDAAERGDIGVYGVATWDELRSPPESDLHLDLADLVELAADVGGANHHLRAIQLPINIAMAEAVREPTQAVAGRLRPVVEVAPELNLSVFASASMLQGRLTTGLPPALRDVFLHATTDAQRALAFTRNAPGVTAALVGMRHREHVQENLAEGRPLS